MPLSPELQTDLAGGSLRLRRWDPDKRQVSFHVSDRGGKDVGVLRFAPVAFLCVPARFTVTRLTERNARDLPTDFWTMSAPEATSLSATDVVYFFEVPSGLRHYLVAGGDRYDRT